MTGAGMCGVFIPDRVQARRWLCHTSQPLSYSIDLPLKMELIVCSETSAISTQTPGKHPKENILHSIYKFGFSLKILKAGHWFGVRSAGSWTTGCCCTSGCSRTVGGCWSWTSVQPTSILTTETWPQFTFLCLCLCLCRSVAYIYILIYRPVLLFFTVLNHKIINFNYMFLNRFYLESNNLTCKYYQLACTLFSSVNELLANCMISWSESLNIR
jgi:hypothetical protein